MSNVFTIEIFYDLSPLDLDKHHQLGKNFSMTINGESGDAANFAQYIEKNIALYKMNNGKIISANNFMYLYTWKTQFFSKGGQSF